MHHFSKRLKKKLWYHVLLPLGSALVTVAILDIIACFSWLCKDFGQIEHFGDDEQNLSINVLDILYWIFVTYRVVLSLLLCIGGIFMGRRVVVVIWLIVSMLVDIIHLSETIFVFSKPLLVQTWPLFLAVASAIWGELKIVRIKYRIIRRTLNSDWNNNNNNLLLSASNHVNTNNQTEDECLNNSEEERISGEEMQIEDIPWGIRIQANIVNFIKLARNLYNLLTWHLTGFLFGGNFYKLLHKNHKAVFLEERIIRYVRIFLDALTVVYILQEKKLLLTPWIAIYIFIISAVVAVFLFILLHLNLMTSLFITIYYLVFFIDLFCRSGFLLYCIRLIIKRKELI